VADMGSVDLKLRISGTPGAYKVTAQLDDEVVDADLGALPDNLRAQLEPLQKSILLTTEGLRTRSLGRAQPQPENPSPQTRKPAVGGAFPNFVAGADIKSIQEMGSKLFNCLFQQDVYALYRRALQAVHKKAGGADLPIKLYVEPSELAYIPWETIFDKKALVHLCCYGTTPFARTATLDFDDIYIYDKPPINILGMVSAPKSFIGTPHELNTDAEQAALDQALTPLSKEAKLCWTTSGTFRELKRRLAKGDNGKRWDVFLFIGHGVEGNIVLEEDGGTGYEFLSVEALKGVLTLPLGPRLVILNSCRGAQPIEKGDRFASTAETLVRGGGIAAVVAMQFDISDIMGTTFSPAFFNNLMLDVPIQQAMMLTRLDLQHRGFSEWISPVLYMQSKHGRVVPPTGPPAD
jgi:hypothetical protein